MDKNNIIGLGLMMALLAGYLYYSGNNQKQFHEQKRKDSITAIKLLPPVQSQATADSMAKPATISATDTTNQVAASAQILENKDVKIILTNVGAMPVSVQLKNFKTATGKPQSELFVFNKAQNSFDISYNTNAGSVNHTQQIAFTPTVTKNTVQYTAPGAATIVYTLPDTGYMVNMHIAGNGAINTAQPISLNWKCTAPNTEYIKTTEMQYNAIAYNEVAEGTDQDRLTEEMSKDFTKGLKWLSFKQHYFNTMLIPNNDIFSKVQVNVKPIAGDSVNELATLNATLVLPAKQDIDLSIYSGPNDYKLLKSYGKEMEEIIPLGYGIITFVKYINKWIVMPIFNFLSRFISNYGIVILLLTVIVRLLMAPITYKSYVSGAKMKVLKPEIDELKAKYADNQQEFGMKQMELFRSTGVSPLGGCLPALAQLPIFFALLQFFPNSIDLRQKSFLWTKDLSTFDSILNFGNLPIIGSIYGDHISLWTLLFVITSLILALTSMSNMSNDQNNPMLKYMPFIMPVIFLGIFNKLPASMTFYYFVSNVITIILQYVIQNYIIDEKKLRVKIEENKKAGPKTNKLMEKMQEIQKQNQERLKQQGKK
jgi:YidC/Oxa1 family membrane protein insertase